MVARLPLFLLAVTATAAVVGSAATLGGVSSSAVAAGPATVARCDTDGITVAYTTSGGNVTHVTVGDIADPGCEGGGLAVTLVDSTNARIASAATTTVPTDADTSPNSLTVAVSPNPDAAAVAAYHVSITGP